REPVPYVVLTALPKAVREAISASPIRPFLAGGTLSSSEALRPTLRSYSDINWSGVLGRSAGSWNQRRPRGRPGRRRGARAAHAAGRGFCGCRAFRPEVGPWLPPALRSALIGSLWRCP